ncbi:hypothetical protein KC315_g5467 [Hortaea werneckii]|nr:hypothetical protein KC315_g5467 [Hortaea werneckii]KAI7489598.1 hypothetical protein KC351_g1163 [Hortaea werneckii]
MGFKTLFLVGYQLLTAHVRKWQKWASTKANAVINCLECVFWLAVIVCTGKALKGSYGVAAAMSALAMVFSIVLIFLAMWTAVVSVKQRRRQKQAPKAYDGSLPI